MHREAVGSLNRYPTRKIRRALVRATDPHFGSYLAFRPRGCTICTASRAPSGKSPCYPLRYAISDTGRGGHKREYVWPSEFARGSGVTTKDRDSTYYELLGVARDATSDEIRVAFNRLIKRVHPDQGGSAALARQLTEARDVLLDPTRRHDYDLGRLEDERSADSEEPAEDVWEDQEAWRSHGTGAFGASRHPPPPWASPRWPRSDEPPSSPPRTLQRHRTNGYAKASAWLAFLSLIGVLFVSITLSSLGSVLAMVLGVKGWRDIRASGGTECGLMRASVGIAVGALGASLSLPYWIRF